MVQATEKIDYSPAEYLDLEIRSEIRHEYRDGEIVAMTGGTPNHNQILLNLAGALNFFLRQHPYRVFAADQRLWISQRRIYTYPDVMVVKEPLLYQEGRQDTLTNPLLIVEVLSQSTRDYDRGDKFVAYRTIPSFQEYLLVDQYSYQVEHYIKAAEKRWALQVHDSLEEVVELAIMPFTIALSDIYNKVEFQPASPRE